MDEAERLSEALDRYAESGALSIDRGDAQLVALGEEIRSACAGLRLSPARRRLLLERALMAGQPTLDARPRRWIRGLRRRMPATVVGGTALVTLAAIGLRVAHQRRAQTVGAV